MPSIVAATPSSKSSSLDELCRFGRAVDADKLESIGVEPGGFIIPGGNPSAQPNPGEASSRDVGPLEGSGEGTEAGEGTTPQQRQREGAEGASETSPDASAYAVGPRIACTLRLGEFEEWYPETRIYSRSSIRTVLSVPVGIVRTLPYRATLFLEIPHAAPYNSPKPATLTADGARAFVPDVRVWGIWDSGIVVRGFHEYPDLSLCTYMKGQWIWGRDPLRDCADWCVGWVARLLHLRHFDRWPGRQHASANVRVKRHRPEEFCGCSSHERWRDCCMKDDLARSSYDLFIEEERARTAYLSELRSRQLQPSQPWIE